MIPIVFLGLFAVLVLFGLRLNKGLAFQEEYMSIPDTTAIKGIFVVIVVLSHLTGYLELNSGFDFLLGIPSKLLGQMMVIPFLFYSGYGIMVSVKRKGQSYVRSIPTRRFLKTLLHFDIAIVLYMILYVAMGYDLTVRKTVLSLIGWDSLGNSNWFIFLTLVLYIFTYISCSVFRNKPKISAFAVLGFAVVFAVVLRTFNLKEEWWYDTVVFYPMGMLYACWKPEIEKLLRKNAIWIPAFLIASGVFAVLRLKFFGVFRYNELIYTAFLAVLILFTMRVRVYNKVLLWLGKHVFSIYILQRIPMRIMDHFGVNNAAVFLIVSFAATILLAWIFDLLLNKLDAVLFDRKKVAHAAS